MPVRPSLVMMPMVRAAGEPRMVVGLLPNVSLLPIIETAEGIENAPAIAKASAAVIGLTLGGKDLSLDLGAV